MPKDKPGTERPVGTKAPDARDDPAEEMPDDFLDLAADANPRLTEVVEAELSVEEASAEEEPEPAAEEPEPEEEVEVAEEEAEEEAEVASEEEDSPKKGGKSRSQRRKEQTARDKSRIETLEAELASFDRMKPQIDFILNDPEISKMVQNRKAGKPLTEPEFKVPEKPTPPVRPRNFSRERAIEDQESPDAQFLNDNEDYPVKVEVWREEKEKVENERNAAEKRENKKREAQEAQTQWWNEITSNIIKAVKADSSVADEDVEDVVADALEILGDPKVLSSGTALWTIARNHMGRTQAVKKAKTSPKKIKPVPAPATVSSDAALPKGWVPKKGDEADAMEQEWLKT